MVTRIIATIPKSGVSTGKAKISFEVDGVRGESCALLTRAFEAAITSADTESTLKSEYYDTEERHEYLNEG
jgi:hypothetical protein